MNNLPNQNFAMQQYNDMLNMNQADIVNRAMLSGINMETLQNLIRQDVRKKIALAKNKLQISNVHRLYSDVLGFRIHISCANYHIDVDLCLTIHPQYPNSTPEQQKMMTQRAIIEMYTYMERESMRQQQMAAVAANVSFYCLQDS